jgi:leucyl aminopeptidase (aminopeptidase T)
MEHEGNPMGESPRWAANIVHTCMGVQPGERVLIAVDEPLGAVREALRAGPAELWTYALPDTSRPFPEFPETYVDLASRMDAVILFLASLDPVVELPAPIAARSAISRGRARYAEGAHIDQSILEHELSTDYEQIYALTISLADRLRGSSSVRVTTPLGTDLRLSVAGREWITDNGLLRGHGVYGNLPAGEVFVAPVEDSAEGMLVVDESLPGLRLTEPVRLVFEA